MRRVMNISYKDPAYAREYYHKTNLPCLCECGMTINKRQLCKHRKTRVHADMLRIEEIDKLFMMNQEANTLGEPNTLGTTQ